MMVIVSDVKENGDGGGGEGCVDKCIDSGGVRYLNCIYVCVWRMWWR